MNKKINYYIKTFGCKVNTYDTALIQKNLDTHFLQTDTPDKASVHIINTCAVTAEAVKEAKRWIKKYKKKYPENRILVTGCAAQVETKQFSDLKEVDLIIGNSHKSEIADIVNKAESVQWAKPQGVNSVRDGDSKLGVNSVQPVIYKSLIFKKTPKEQMGQLESNHTRLFLKIQDGCDSFCTFCIIPFARGKSRSIVPSDLVDSVNKHYDQGVREVVLTGVHIGDYQIVGSQNKNDLAELVHILLEKTKMPRIRLSSLEPIELNDKLLDVFTSPRICPHFHLSIQSTQSEILHRMKRNYNSDDVQKTLIQINQKFPQAFVGMDLISGFAGETQKQFEESYQQLKDWPWTKIHVFPYSPRHYTYAQRAYPAWPRSLVMKRAALIRHLSNSRLNTERAKQIGTIKAVLPFKTSELKGMSRDYWTVKWNNTNKQKTKSDREIYVRIDSEQKGFLQGYRE